MTIDNNQGTGNNRQKILDAATRMVMEKGVKGTSLADIAREAGISKGTLFYYYAAKDDLIYEITVQHFDRAMRELLHRIEQMKNEPLKKIMYEGAITILMAEKRGRLNLYLLQEAVMGNEALKARFRETYQDYRNLMEQFLALVFAQIEPDQRQVISTMLVALLDGLIIQWLLEPEAVPVDKIAELLASVTT